MEKILYKNLELNVDLKSCFISGKEIKLTKSEYFLLEFMLSNKNKVFTRRELLKVLGDKKTNLRIVDSLISRIRKKLENYSKIIISKLGIGYGIFIFD